jgi:hypothetical protein
MAAATTLGLSILFLVLWKSVKRLLRPNLPLPPGPNGWPIIGNLLQIPKDFEHETYRAWARECGTFVIFPVLLDTDSGLTSDIWHQQIRTSSTSMLLGSHSCSLTNMRLR